MKCAACSITDDLIIDEDGTLSALLCKNCIKKLEDITESDKELRYKYNFETNKWELVT